MYTVPVGQNPCGIVCSILELLFGSDTAARPWTSSAKGPFTTFAWNMVRPHPTTRLLDVTFGAGGIRYHHRGG
jgi:hypothetical protein